MSERRRFVAIVVLFLIGFGMVALADATDSYVPLFLTPVPYALIPWIIVRHERQAAPGTVAAPNQD